MARTFENRIINDIKRSRADSHADIVGDQQNFEARSKLFRAVGILLVGSGLLYATYEMALKPMMNSVQQTLHKAEGPGK
jgi:hypothetical protein